MKRIIVSIFLMWTWALFSSTFSFAGSACFCAQPPVPKAVERASAVFVGEVVDIIEPKTSDERAPLPGHFFTIKFKVEKSWKGVTSGEVDVLSAQGKYDCFAYPVVKKGEKYLVYADQPYQNNVPQEGWLIITTCNRTALIPDPQARIVKRPKAPEFNREDASEDLKALEQISQPIFWFESRLKTKNPPGAF